jgi:glutathione S-transferase
VREYLEHEFKLDEPTRIKWCQHWHTAALTALEAHLKDAATGRYCHGDAITLADVCLEPGRRSKILLGRHRAVFEFHPDR